MASRCASGATARLSYMGDLWSAVYRNFERAAHEVLAASRRHQSHSKVSCLSFLRRKPLDELSVSCSGWREAAKQTSGSAEPRMLSCAPPPGNGDLMAAAWPCYWLVSMQP
jgi:hypothetical protein